MVLDPDYGALTPPRFGEQSGCCIHGSSGNSLTLLNSQNNGTTQVLNELRMFCVLMLCAAILFRE